MEITSAEFVISNTDVKKCPAGIFPEYAFIGRSNVGKSSLINMLTSRKGLAMTSSTPGKTMLINHFLINKNWYLVDLPGYGYGFIGGACGFCAERGEVWFAGDPLTHPDGAAVVDFVTSRGFRAFPLGSGRLLDCGGMFFF